MGGSPQPRDKEEKPAHLPRTRQNRTEEKLVVRVLQGYNLRGDDGGFSDTYAQVTVTDGDPRTNDRQRKEKTVHAIYETEVMKKNNNPSWHSVAYEPFKGLNIHPTSTGVRLSVWDWDAGSADDQLGKRSVTLKQLRQWSHDFAHEGEHIPAFEDDRGELSREGIVWLHHGDGLAAEVVAAVQLGDKGVSRLRELLEAGGSLFARNSCGDSAWTVVWSVRKNIEQGVQPAVPFQQMVQLVVRESCVLNAQGESLVPQALDTRLSHGFTRKRLAMTEPGEPGMDVNGTDDPTRPQEVVLEYKFVSRDEYARRYMLPPARADDAREGAYKKEAKRVRKLEKERLKELKRTQSQDLSNATSAKPSAITDNGRPQTKPGATNGTKATLSKTPSKLSAKAVLSKLSPAVQAAVTKFVGLHTNVSCPSLRLHVRGVGVHGWNGEPHCRGTYENEMLLKTFFSKYGVVDHTTVRHRIADKHNTSWALVTMQDQAGVEAVLSAAKVDPGIICGTHRLHIERFQLSLAEESTGMMKNIMEKDDYPNYQFQISVHNFKVEDTAGHAAWKMLQAAFVQQSKSWRSAIQEPWDPHLDSTWVRPTHTTVGNASAFSCPYGPHDPKGIMTSVKKQKEAPLLGVVTVTVVSCTHLPQMDGIFANDGTGADPYVVCGVNNHIARTTVRMNTQDPEWPEEEGKMTLPITAPSDEVHIIVVDFDSAAIGSGTSGSAHDLIGRVWPPICVRDLEYGEEKSFELQLHDCPEGFDFSAIDAQNKVEKWAMDAHSNRNSRGTVHIRLRYDITKPKVWANGDFKTRLKARAKVYKSYMLYPRIAAAPIEIKNFPVRERMDGMACIPKNVYLILRSGYTEDYDLNYTMNLQYDTELKMGYASPFRGVAGIKGNLNRVLGLLEPFKVFGAGLKDVLIWKSIPWSLTVLYAWTYFMFNPGLILPFLVSLLFAKVAKEGLLRATGTTFTVQPEKEGPWEAWEDARLWRMAHSSTLDSLVESSRWAAISKWVSHGDGGVRPIEACRERLAEIRANYTDSDSESEEEKEENDGEGGRGVKGKKHRFTDTFAKIGYGAIRDKDRKRKKDKVEFLLKTIGLGHVLKHLQMIQNLLGLIASFGEKIGAICIFEDQIVSSIFLVLLALVAFLIYFIPLNYVVWAIGMIVLTKKSPLKGIVGQIKTVVPWLKSPPSDTELKHYWYALKYKNRAKYPDWPALRLGCPLEEPFDFIWHAPSRARVGFGKRAHKDFHGWHQAKHETKLYEKRHAEREAAALRVLEKLETHVARTAPARPRPRPTSTSHHARRVMRASMRRLQGKDDSL